MVLNIKDESTDRLARELAAATGESLTLAVATALRERLQRVRTATAGRALADELTRIALRTASLPELDRVPEDAVAYDEHGAPR